MLDPETWWWWTSLKAVALLNLVVWLWIAFGLWRSRNRAAPSAGLDTQQRHMHWQLALSAGYVIGCGWRSMMPVFDVPRLVLVDSFWSSVLMGRSVATVAELCLAAQWVLMLREAARAHPDRRVNQLAAPVLPMIALAEGFSWYSVLSTDNFGHMVEESLWACSALLVTAALLRLWPRAQPATRRLLGLWAVGGAAYTGYLITVDVPMYARRWLLDEAAGRPYLTLRDGWVDIASRWHVNGAWQHWQSEVLWMSAYFSVAVWMSLTLAAAACSSRASVHTRPPAENL